MNLSSYSNLFALISAEYDHPCVVSKSRRKVAITMNNVFQEVNDWEQFAQDNRI